MNGGAVPINGQPTTANTTEIVATGAHRHRAERDLGILSDAATGENDGAT